MLRIEDLDTARTLPGAVDRILADLEWLGLDWDEGPLLQSTDPGPAQRALRQLLDSGRAYACTCSRREIESIQSAPHASDGTLRYPGTCRGRWASVEEAERATGRPAGIRFLVPPGPVTWTDALLGPRSLDVSEDAGDFLLARRDGVLGYQLAVVVDDARVGINEVLRGDDLDPSTARQVLLQDALGLPHPTWVHVPLVLDEAGRRLAKRDAARSLVSLREAGADPERIVHWAASSAGVPTRGPLPARSVLPLFPTARLTRRPTRLGAADLASLFPGTPPAFRSFEEPASPP